MSRCNGCGAEILWTLTENDKRMPLDAIPNPEGNVVLVERRARVLGPLERTLAADEGAEFYMPHHATCPKVEEFRR